MITGKPAQFVRRAMNEIVEDCVDGRHYNFLVSLRRLADAWEMHEAEIESLKAEILKLRRQLEKKRLTLDELQNV
jgi:SMC interacting uncharacterized protein involved in chromosome segregation